MEAVKETKRTVVNVPDITCGGCAGSIKNALGKMKGITQIEVDVASKNVTIEHDETISREQIAEKLDDIGFPIG